MIPYKLQIAILQIDMAAPSSTTDGQEKIFEELLCSLDLSPGQHGQLTFVSFLNFILSHAYDQARDLEYQT